MDNIYDEVAREAEHDRQAWLADEYVAEMAEGTYGDMAAAYAAYAAEFPTACPICGGGIEVDAADPSVGFFTDEVTCEDPACGWAQTY